MITARAILLTLGVIVLAGCATPRATDRLADANDPLESLNRASFNATLAVDKAVFRPTAIVYRSVVPEFFRDGVRNMLNNLRSPVILANDLLQGETERAGVTLVRAGVNTTLGLGGFFDMAQRWGYVRHSEDFGQTLGTYGMGEGPYIWRQ